VPAVWTSVSYLSLKPLASWFKDMLARFEFMSNWIANGPPAAFWMSAFFFPQGFMTAALQTHARATQIAIDTMDFRTEVNKEWFERCEPRYCVGIINTMLQVQSMDSEEVRERPPTGVYIYGLFIEGCRWSRFAQRAKMVMKLISSHASAERMIASKRVFL